MPEAEADPKSSDDTATAVGLGVAGLLAIFAAPAIVAYVKQAQPKPLSFTQLQLQALREATTDPEAFPAVNKLALKARMTLRLPLFQVQHRWM